jgi:hypothetical protein
MIQVQMLVSRKERFCTERNTLRFAPVEAIDGNPLASVIGLALLYGAAVAEFCGSPALL